MAATGSAGLRAVGCESEGGLERLPPEQKVGGSNPLGRTIQTIENTEDTRRGQKRPSRNLYPLVSNSKKVLKTGGILGDKDAEEKRHFRTFARNLCG